ncbi:MAG: PrsW family intramembrane metalloprotease [Burkholderiaceae bacterium]|nr:PrsW family intramembrane metalloprotease [Burkholderiaceae bacterium]
MNESENATAIQLVEAEMDAASLHAKGVLRVLRTEAGPLILFGLAWAGLGITGIIVKLGSAGWLVLALALLPAAVLLQLTMWLDRVEAKPVWLLIRCVLWGAGPAIIGAGVVNSVVAAKIGLRGSAFVSAPLIEEAMKALALVWLLRHRRDQIHGALDAAMYAMCVGIGFAAVENVQYYAAALHKGLSTLAATVIGRGLITPLAHPLFTFATALGIASAANRRAPALIGYPLLGYACAVSAHSLWNTFPLTWVFVIPGFVTLALWIYRASRAEERDLQIAVERAVSRGELPGNAAALIGPSRRPRFFEWTAAAIDPGHWLYERWRRHHLALIMALPAVAAQIADDDPRKQTSPELVQAAATQLLRRRIGGTT